MKEGGDGETRDREVSLPIHKSSQEPGGGQFVGWDREKDRDRNDVSSPSPLFSAGVPFSPALLAANTQAAALQAALMASLAAARQNYPLNSGIPLLTTPGVPSHTPSAGINSYASLHTLVNANPSLLSAAHREAFLSTWSKLAHSTVSSLGSLSPSGYSPDSGTPSGKSINSSNQTSNKNHNTNLPPLNRSHSDVMNVALAHLGAELAAGYPSPEGYPTGPKSPTAGSSPASNNSSGGLSSSGSTKQDSKRHGSRDTNSREKVFVCKVCNRCFGYKHVLQNHERTHTGEKPFECKECHKRFTRDHHLKTHMRLHTGEKPYHCTHCERQFVQVANLRRHLRVHTGERPYACELCTSRFSDSNQLKAHMLIHKGEKPFQCPKCLGRFRRRHHLMHHKCPNEELTIEKAKRGRKPKLSDDEHEVTTRIIDIVETPQTVVPEIEKKRERKLKDPHKVIRLSGVPVATITSSEPLRTRPNPLPDPSRDFEIPVFRGLQPRIPEQTEPEDLSMSTGVNRNLRYRRLSEMSHSSGGENDFSDGTYSESIGDVGLEDPHSDPEITNTNGPKDCFRMSKNGEICVENSQR